MPRRRKMNMRIGLDLCMHEPKAMPRHLVMSAPYACGPSHCTAMVSSHTAENQVRIHQEQMRRAGKKAAIKQEMQWKRRTGQPPKNTFKSMANRRNNKLIWIGAIRHCTHAVKGHTSTTAGMRSGSNISDEYIIRLPFDPFNLACMEIYFYISL